MSETTPRAMANSLRRPVQHILTEEEVAFIKSEAETIGIPSEMLKFNEGTSTSFHDKDQKIYVRGNVFPDEQYGFSARDLMSVRATLAHEYFGHSKMHPSPYSIGSWEDEFWASYNAAINTPNLTTTDRRHLMMDAYDRAKEAGAFEGFTDEARRILYGSRYS